MISAVILAAGSSSRMGQSKLLLPFSEHMTMIEKIITTIKESCLFHEIILVYSDERVRAIASSCGIITAFNPNALLGQSTSIIQGIHTADSNTEAYMFFAGDQPLIDKVLIETLINEYSCSKKEIIVPEYGGKPGLPTIFKTSFKTELLKLTGDIGGRNIIKQNPEVVKMVKIDAQIKGMDIDTPQDYDNLQTKE